MRVLCECNSHDCRRVIDLPVSVLMNIKNVSGRVVIVNGCSTGLEPTDVLVSAEPGYSTYQEKKGDDR